METLNYQNPKDPISVEDIDFFTPTLKNLYCTYRPSTGTLVFSNFTSVQMGLIDFERAGALIGKHKDKSDKALYLKVVGNPLPSDAFRFNRSGACEFFLDVSHLFMRLEYHKQVHIKFLIQRVDSGSFLFKLTQVNDSNKSK